MWLYFEVVGLSRDGEFQGFWSTHRIHSCVGDMLSDPAPSTMLLMLEGDHHISLRGAPTLVISSKQFE